MNICVYGAVRNDIDNKFIENAELLEKIMADRNHNVVFCGMKVNMQYLMI